MDNNTVNQFTTDGFSFAQPGSDITELALLSLKIALESYFSTYSSVKYSIAQIDNSVDLGQDQIDWLHNSQYRQLYAETIVHFQHFAELVCKDLLRGEHILLSVDASNRPVLFHKLLKGEEITSSDWEDLKSIEFSEALERIQRLNAARRLPSVLGFFTQYNHCLKSLNLLRNRIWHRGTYVLRYIALDRFITGCILPFVFDVMNLPNYVHKVSLWKYKTLSCGIDPLVDLVTDARSGSYNLGKAAFLKELARAAYHNPILFVPETGFGRSSLLQENARVQHQAEQAAKAAISNGNAYDIRICPVCGLHSLVLYSDTEIEGDPSEPNLIWSHTYAGECLCCSFSVNKSLQNPRNYGLDHDDYWFVIS